MKKIDISYNFLYNNYITQGKSMNIIAQEIGTTAMTIFHRLKEYNIPRRDTAIWRGKKRPEHSQIMKGRKNIGVSIANKKRVGKNALNYIDGRFLVNHYCYICNKPISYKTWKDGNKHCKSCSNRINMTGRHLSVETKQKLSISSLGKNNGMFGKIIKPNWIEYNNKKFRSSWEVIYAKELDSIGIKWLYESKTFDLGNTTYTPDFYLPETNEYIEIKGYKSEVFIKKFELFKQLYSEVKIKILDETYFRRKVK